MAGRRGAGKPWLANIYLHYLDRIWTVRCPSLRILVRYADEFCGHDKDRGERHEAHRRIGLVMERLGLHLHLEKTRLVNLSRGQKGFVFLGCVMRKRRSIQRKPWLPFVQRWPSPGAMKRMRCHVRKLTEARRCGIKGVGEMIADLNPALRGWGNYFRTGNADGKFNQVDTYVYRRLIRWQDGQRAAQVEAWSQDRFYEKGLHRLQGTVRYPAQATPRRSSVSRVRENRTHGLKGGCWKRTGA